jgi:hypothetical protein
LLSFCECRIPQRIFCSGGWWSCIVSDCTYHGRLLLLHLFWMIVFLGRKSVLFNIVNFCTPFFSLFCSVTLSYLFRGYMSSFICFCVLSYSLFFLSWISWVAPVHFCWHIY